MSPDSRVKEGIETIVWEEMNEAKRDVGGTVLYDDVGAVKRKTELDQYIDVCGHREEKREASPVVGMVWREGESKMQLGGKERTSDSSHFHGVVLVSSQPYLSGFADILSFTRLYGIRRRSACKVEPEDEN